MGGAGIHTCVLSRKDECREVPRPEQVIARLFPPWQPYQAYFKIVKRPVTVPSGVLIR